MYSGTAHHSTADGRSVFRPGWWSRLLVAVRAVLFAVAAAVQGLLVWVGTILLTGLAIAAVPLLAMLGVVAVAFLIELLGTALGGF